MVSLTALVMVSSMMAGQLSGDTPLPADITAQIQYLMGEWEMKGTIGDVDTTGKWSCAWSPSKHSYIIACSRTSEPVAHMDSLGGYDPFHKQMIEKIFWSDGSHYTITYDASTPIKDKGIVKGEITGIENGKEMKAPVTVERMSSKEFTFSSQTSDGKLIKVVFRKIK